MSSIRGNTDSKAQSNITNVLQKLKVLVLSILGDGQDSGVVNDTAFVIIALLFNEEKILNKHKNILKQTFGINQDEEVTQLFRVSGGK